jgi:hypothetical protein
MSEKRVITFYMKYGIIGFEHEAIQSFDIELDADVTLEELFEEMTVKSSMAGYKLGKEFHDLGGLDYIVEQVMLNES